MSFTPPGSYSLREHTAVILFASYNPISVCPTQVSPSKLSLKRFPQGWLWCMLQCGSSPGNNGVQQKMCTLVTALKCSSWMKGLFNMKLLLVNRLALFIQGDVEIQEVVVDFEGEQRSRRREQTCE